MSVPYVLPKAGELELRLAAAPRVPDLHLLELGRTWVDRGAVISLTTDELARLRDQISQYLTQDPTPAPTPPWWVR